MDQSCCISQHGTWQLEHELGTWCLEAKELSQCKVQEATLEMYTGDSTVIGECPTLLLECSLADFWPVTTNELFILLLDLIEKVTDQNIFLFIGDGRLPTVQGLTKKKNSICPKILVPQEKTCIFG